MLAPDSEDRCAPSPADSADVHPLQTVGSVFAGLAQRCTLLNFSYYRTHPNFSICEEYLANCI